MMSSDSRVNEFSDGNPRLKVAWKNVIVDIEQAYKHIKLHQAKCDNSVAHVKYLMLFAETDECLCMCF